MVGLKVRGSTLVVVGLMVSESPNCRNFRMDVWQGFGQKFHRGVGGLFVWLIILVRILLGAETGL